MRNQKGPVIFLVSLIPGADKRRTLRRCSPRASLIQSKPLPSEILIFEQLRGFSRPRNFQWHGRSGSTPTRHLGQMNLPQTSFFNSPLRSGDSSAWRVTSWAESPVSQANYPFLKIASIGKLSYLPTVRYVPPVLFSAALMLSSGASPAADESRDLQLLFRVPHPLALSLRRV